VSSNCRRMPGYPRIDKGNPYLTARYDHGIVDSMPWGRGWPAEGRVSSAALDGSTFAAHCSIWLSAEQCALATECLLVAHMLAKHSNQLSCRTQPVIALSYRQ
jgi:hypothetical protein